MNKFGCKVWQFFRSLVVDMSSFSFDMNKVRRPRDYFKLENFVADNVKMPFISTKDKEAADNVLTL